MNPILIEINSNIDELIQKIVDSGEKLVQFYFNRDDLELLQWNNKQKEKTLNLFKELLKKLPSSVTQIGFFQEPIFFLNPVDVINILTAIPEHVNSLDLSGANYNESNSKPICSYDQLILILKSIPSSVITIKFSGNKLGLFSPDQRKKIVQAISKKLS